MVNGTFQPCAKGHEGALCSYCQSGYAMVTGACELCEGGSTASRLIGVCVGFVVFLGVLLWYLYKLNKTEQEADEARHREEEVAGGRIRTARLSAHVGIDKARALKPAFKSVYQYVQVERASHQARRVRKKGAETPRTKFSPHRSRASERRSEHPEHRFSQRASEKRSERPE
jgi:hypothetical protein